jgi:hypothetical protein
LKASSVTKDEVQKWIWNYTHGSDNFFNGMTFQKKQKRQEQGGVGWRGIKQLRK